VREAIFFGGLILAGVLWLFFPLLRATYSDYQTKRMIYEMERPYREDAYGGLTPEATYALFIAALKKGDIDLASKYFSPKRQAEWLKELKAQKEKGTLEIFITNLPNMQKLEKFTSEDKGYIEYSGTDFTKKKPKESVEINGKKINLPERHVTYEVSFIENGFTHKWKIESL